MALSEGEETDDIEPGEQPEFAGENIQGNRRRHGREEAGPGNVAKVELAEVDELRGLRHAPRPVARDVATLRKEAPGRLMVAKRPGPEMSRRWNLPRSTNCGDSVTRRAPSRATSPPCERRHPGVSGSRRGRARKCREGGTCRGRRIAGTPSRAAPRRARRRHPAKGGTRASQGRD